MNQSTCIPRRTVTFDYLVEQSEDQVRYYTQYGGVIEYTWQDRKSLIYYRMPQKSNNDRIFELLLEEERLRRRDPRVTRHLMLTGSTSDEWRRNGELFLGHQRAHALNQLRYLQAELIKIDTERQVEVDELHNRVRGPKKAKKIIAKINGRWKQLDNMVKKYNAEIRKVREVNSRESSAKDIGENGIENDAIWDIERFMSNSDWAVIQYVRDGIWWYFVQQWVVEERRMLQLHAQRLIKWLNHQTDVLLNLLHCEMRMDSHHLEELLLHCFRIMRSRSTIRHDSLFPLDQMEKPRRCSTATKSVVQVLTYQRKQVTNLRCHAECCTTG